MADYDQAMVTARTYLSHLAANDHVGSNRILCDLANDKDGQTIPVIMALANQALDWADVLDRLGLLEGGLVKWLNAMVFKQLDDIEATQPDEDDNEDEDDCE